MTPLTRRHFLRRAGAVCGAATLPSLAAQAAPPPIKIGQIGTGHAHASGKMETMRKSPDFEVVGICEPDPQRRAAAEKSKAYADMRWLTEAELFALPGLQAVAVETTVGDLLATGLRCVEAGLHIHLDKPAGESLPAFQHLLQEAARRRLVVQMGYMFRSNPAFQLCAKLLRDGVLGDIFSIDAVMSKDAGAGERKSLHPYRGGSMFELGCHVIDRAVEFLGRPDKVTAYNRTGSTSSDGLLDNGLAVLEYPHATGTIRSSLLEIGGIARRQFTVCGTKGTFTILPLEAPKARLALDTPTAGYTQDYQDIAFPKMGGRYDGDFAEMAAVLRGEYPYPITMQHDLAVQESVLLASGLPTA